MKNLLALAAAFALVFGFASSVWAGGGIPAPDMNPYTQQWCDDNCGIPSDPASYPEEGCTIDLKCGPEVTFYSKGECVSYFNQELNMKLENAVGKGRFSELCQWYVNCDEEDFVCLVLHAVWTGLGNDDPKNVGQCIQVAADLFDD